MSNTDMRANLQQIDFRLQKARQNASRSYTMSTAVPRGKPVDSAVPLHTFIKLATWQRPADRTIEHDWSLLAHCNTYGKLVRYMTAAVLGKLAQPVYGDYDINDTTDNHWWFHSDRWRLLVAINRYGLVTINANEGEETIDESPTDYMLGQGYLWHDQRVTLFFICPAAQYRALQQHMQSKYFFVDAVPHDKTDDIHMRMYASSFRQNAVTEMTRDGTSSPWPYNEMTVIPMPKTAIQDTVSVCLVDPKSNRPATSSSGLFTVLVDYLRTSALRREFGF